MTTTAATPRTAKSRPFPGGWYARRCAICASARARRRSRTVAARAARRMRSWRRRTLDDGWIPLAAWLEVLAAFERRVGDPPTLRLLREMTRATMAAAVSTVWGTFLATARRPSSCSARVGDFWSVSFDTGKLVVVERGAASGQAGRRGLGRSAARGGRDRRRGVRGVPGAHRLRRAARRRQRGQRASGDGGRVVDGVLVVDEAAEVAGRRRDGQAQAPRARMELLRSPWSRRGRDQRMARLATKSAAAQSVGERVPAGERARGRARRQARCT